MLDGHVRWYRLEGTVPVKIQNQEELIAHFRDLERHPLKRIIARTRIGKTVISTVFLGLDHSWGSHKIPILFETMVFDEVPKTCVSKLDQSMWRYATYHQAEQGHEHVVELVKRRNRNPIVALIFGTKRTDERPQQKTK